MSAATALTSAKAEAQDLSGSITKSGWVVTLGGTGFFGPSYPGAKTNEFSALPTFDLRRNGEPESLTTPDDGLSYDFLQFGDFTAGPVGGLRASRSVSDAKSLKGLKKIDLDVDAGLFAQYWIIPDVWRVRTEIRQALSNGTGLVVDAGSDFFVHVNDNWLASVGPRVSFGNDAYMRSYFGINAGQAAANGRVSSFNARGGLKSIGVAAAISYKIDSTWTAQVYDRYDRLVGDAGDSPISSSLGSDDQNVIGFALKKTFDVNF